MLVWELLTLMSCTNEKCVIRISCLRVLIVCVSEGSFFKLLCVHNVGKGTFDLHGLILCVSEGFLSQ